MMQRPYKTLLVLLIFAQVASARSAESSLLLGTIQFPKDLKEDIEDIPVIYHGDPAATQLDQTNKMITFSIPRESSQFLFKLLIVEPQHVEPVSLTSKYQTEPTNLVAYHKVKAGSPYRYFSLNLIPEITKDKNGSNVISYCWKTREERINHEGRIPDDAIIMHAAPDWIARVETTSGLNFPTIQMRDDLASSDSIKKKFGEIALARLDLKQFEGKPQQVAMKKVGNAIIIAPPLHAAG